jgi:hypothetical protein
MEDKPLNPIWGPIGFMLITGTVITVLWAFDLLAFNSTTLYSEQCASGFKGSKCKEDVVYSWRTYKIDTQNNRVIYWSDKERETQQYANCVIQDKTNWVCPTVTMKNGSIGERKSKDGIRRDVSRIRYYLDQ